MKQNTVIHKVQLKCLVCGADKMTLEEEAPHICNLCGQEFEADATCENEHFVCHTCRQQNSRQRIIQHCLESTQIDPYALTLELMKLPDTAIHGPEHHLLLTAALLTTYCNTKGRDDLPALLEEANERSMQVPGGACGFWGICGAAVGTGIFSSIITESSPYAEKEWEISGQFTAACANAISEQGGPRCCKRDSFTALKQAIRLCNQHFNTAFRMPNITCQFFVNNKECKGRQCPFFPTRNKPDIPGLKQLHIDFLYLDLNTCERCMATDETLKQALHVLSCVLDTLGLEVKVNPVNISTRKLAEEYHFISSPTIRVNGVDICNELVESDCTDCGDLCGDSVDCRVFVYEGKEYERPPVPMIVDGILKAIYGQQSPKEETYTLPDNLERFFSGKNSCCDSACGYSNTPTHTTLRSDLTMKTMSIYEPAMCCETGICGVGVDPELLRISTVFNNLQKNGITAARFNLNSAPQAFINNTDINKLIMGDGVESLPATVIDGKIVKTKAYPTNAEIAAWLEIPASYLEATETKKSDGGCCCSEGCCQ